MNPYAKKVMHEFTPDALGEIFLQQYKYEYGEQKLRDVVSKVENSPKVHRYIDSLLATETIPKAAEIEILLNSIAYFMFSKEETLCLGGLAIVSLWQSRWIEYNNFPSDELRETMESRLIIPYVDLISRCSQNKYLKEANFFTRFSEEIDRIGKNEGLI